MNKAFIKDLVKNKKEHIEFKKAQFKKADAVLNVNFVSPIVNKALSTSSKNDTESVIKRTIIGNTYNWLDSHGDVHVDGTFGKSIKERGGVNKIWHLHDHEQKVTAKIGKPLSVKEEIVKWSDLGVDKIGSTTVVMMETNIMKTYNSFMFHEYKDGNIDQHSVGMYYVKIDLAVNDADFEEENKLWNEHIDILGNKAQAEELGYMWIVKEAKLIEISAVLEGSNILTPTIASKDIEPLQDTQKVEPSKDTQNTPSSSKSTTYYY